MTLARRPSVPHVATLLVGLFFGWSAATRTAPTLRASAGVDRWDESILASGPAFIKFNKGSEIQVAQDVIYYLDYRAGKLIATIPSMQQIGGTARYLSAFAERDLVADFKIDLETGARPHFMMTTASMASGSGNTFGDGWAPLFVFETGSRQVAVYKVQQQIIGTAQQVRCDLVELRPFTKSTAAR